jgi:hypothetical protein
MRSAVRGFLVVLIAGLALLAVVGLVHGSALVYSLGVQPQQVVANLRTGDRVCQAPIRLPPDQPFERIGFRAAGAGDMDVSVEAVPSGTVLARSRVAVAPAGAALPPMSRARFAHVLVHRPVAVCFTNRGSAPAVLWGTVNVASGPTSATLNGTPLNLDVAVQFERPERSIIALMPRMADRASLFQARLLSPTVYAILAALVLLGVPALLVLALRSIDRSAGDELDPVPAATAEPVGVSRSDADQRA